MVMVKVMFLLCFMVTVVSVYGQDTTSQRNAYRPEVKEVQIVNEKIETRDLPMAVRKSLEGQEYRGWLINSVHKAPLSDRNNPENIHGVMYIVELVNGTELKALKFDKEGNKLRDE
jgi:hypothetical protein